MRRRKIPTKTLKRVSFLNFRWADVKKHTTHLAIPVISQKGHIKRLALTRLRILDQTSALDHSLQHDQVLLRLPVPEDFLPFPAGSTHRWLPQAQQQEAKAPENIQKSQ